MNEVRVDTPIPEVLIGLVNSMTIEEMLIIDFKIDNLSKHDKTILNDEIHGCDIYLYRMLGVDYFNLEGIKKLKRLAYLSNFNN